MKQRWERMLIVMTTGLLCGCGRGSYVMRGHGASELLIPPVAPRSLAGSGASYEIAMPNARRRPATQNDCDIRGELLELRWSGNTANIRMKPGAYFASAEEQSPEEIGPRIYLDSVRNMEAFRRDLSDRTINGCLRSGEAAAISRRVAESFPLPPAASNLIRFGGGATGFVDLTPDFRLKIVTPAVHAGYQTSYYRIASLAQSAKVRISLSSAAPADPFFAFPASFRLYRLVFRTAVSSSDHQAAIVSAEDEAALRGATAEFEKTTAGSCATPRATCLTVPSAAAVNLEFAVSANGQQIFLPLGANIANALFLAKRIREVPATLRVERAFRGRLRAVKFDRSIQNAGGFVLAPGDRLTW